MDNTMSMKELGALYGVSSHAIGRLLKKEGLRTPAGKPSSRAFQDGFVMPRWSEGSDTYFYVWATAKVIPILEAAGLKMVQNATAT